MPKLTDEEYPPDVTVIRRAGLLKFILTTNPTKEKDKAIEANIDLIRSRYPIVQWVEEAFHEFHKINKFSELDKSNSNAD